MIFTAELNRGGYMKVIGLTGGSGSGKGVAGKLFGSLGCYVIDADALYHKMISADSPCSRALIAHFGLEISNEYGGIDRSCLRDIVFSDSSALAALNSIAHSYVRAECEAIFEEQKKRGTEYVVIDAPQLFEAGMEELCDAVVAVTAKLETRIERIVFRDKITREKAEARIASQHDDAFFEENCDHVIKNDSDAAHLLLAVKHVFDIIKDM